MTTHRELGQGPMEAEAEAEALRCVQCDEFARDCKDYGCHLEAGYHRAETETTGARAPQRAKPPAGVAYTLDDKPGSRHAAELLQQVVNVRYQRAADLKQQAQAEELEANRIYTTGVARIVKDHWGNTIADGTKVSIDLQKGLIKAEPA